MRRCGRRPALAVAAFAAGVLLAGVACYTGEGLLAERTTPTAQEAQINVANLPPLNGPEQTQAAIQVVRYPTPTPSPPGLPRFGGQLRVAWTGPVQRLDPVTTELWTVSSEYHANAVSSHIFETLMGWDENGDVQPVLLESWSLSEDSTTYTLTLRDGLTFHNGDGVTAEDVRMSIDRWVIGGSAQSGTVRGQALSKWLTVVDDLTVTASFRTYMPSFMDIIGLPHMTPYIMPQEQALRYGRRPVNELIGSGPYAFEGWRYGEAISIDRFREYQARDEDAPGYAGSKTPWLDRITWLEVVDPEAQVAGLQSGLFDVLDGAPLDAYKALDADPAIDVLLGTPGNRAAIYLDPSNGAFTDLQVRRALAAAVDVDVFMSAVADTDLWSLCPAVYWCGTPLDVRDGEEFYDQGDVEKGRALLASSGYDGEVVVLISPNNVAWVAALGDELGNVMESIGLTVERPYADFLIFSGMLSRTELYDAFPVWYGYWNGGTPLNDQALSLGNRFVAHDDDLANLQEAYASETDTAKRLGIVRDISRRRLEEAGMILLGTFPHMLPVASGLKGVQLSALPYYGNAWLER